MKCAMLLGNIFFIFQFVLKSVFLVNEFRNLRNNEEYYYISDSVITCMIESARIETERLQLPINHVGTTR